MNSDKWLALHQWFYTRHREQLAPEVEDAIETLLDAHQSDSNTDDEDEVVDYDERGGDTEWRTVN